MDMTEGKAWLLEPVGVTATSTNAWIRGGLQVHFPQCRGVANRIILSHDGYVIALAFDGKPVSSEVTVEVPFSLYLLKGQDKPS